MHAILSYTIKFIMMHATAQELREMDPYRLENMDTYSNILYVKELKVRNSAQDSRAGKFVFL